MTKKQKPEIIFVVENKLGGVAYLNKNLVNNASLAKEVIVKVILVNQLDSDHPRFTDTFKADEMVNFEYGGYENRFSVLKRLRAHFGSSEGAIVCNDGLEMQAIYQHGTNKTVYQIIHDFYNLKLAVKLGAITDVYLTHTKLFRDVLISADPEQNRVFYVPHGVSIPNLQTKEKSHGKLRLVFTGRLVEAKGVHELFSINKLLKQRGIEVYWTIIGKGPLKDFLLDQWKNEVNVSFASPGTNEEVMSLMKDQDIFILPTRFEGSPVTVLEALSAGIVPVVSDLPGGIAEIVEASIGRTISLGKIELFADAIQALEQDRETLMRLKKSGRALAESQFDILETSNNYFKLFLSFPQFKKEHSGLPSIPVGFRLDKEWLPNPLVSFLRKKRSK
jgi:glycosyltransferase involved in cell wall biosynthesis